MPLVNMKEPKKKDNFEKLDELFYTTRNFSQQITFAGYSAGKFGSAVLEGNWALNGLASGLQTAGEAIFKFATTAFEQSAKLEVSRIAMGGVLSNGSNGKLDFKAGLKLGDELREKLVGIAADSIGETADYTQVASGINDSIAEAVGKLGGSAEQFSANMAKISPALVKGVVLNSKVYGDGIPVGAVVRTFTKLLETGKAPAREQFLQRNPGLKAALERDDKKNGSLTKVSGAVRIDRLQKIFDDAIKPEQLALLENAFETKLGALRSAVIGIDDGVFGMNRKLGTDDKGERVTVFSRIADLLKPFMDALILGAKSITQFSDPMLAIAEIIKDKLQPVADELANKLARFGQQFAFAEGNLTEKLGKAFKETFSVDFTKFDFATPITNFFQNITGFIAGAGKDGNFGFSKNIDDAINALVAGIGNIIGAIANRLTDEAIKDPEKFFKIAFIMNPTAFLTFALLIVSLLPSLAFFGKAILGFPAILRIAAAGLLNAFPAISTFFLTAFGPILVSVLAVVAVCVIFRKQLSDLGNWIQSLGGLTAAMLGEVFKRLSAVGQNVYDAFQFLFKGDLSGFAGQLVEAVKNGLIASAALIAMPFLAIGEAFQKAVIDPIAKLLGFGPKPTVENSPTKIAETQKILQREQAASSAIIDPFKGAGLLGFANGNPLGNLLVAYQKEKMAAPVGANVVFANSSEAIIPGNKLSAFSTNSGGNSISMTINNYSGDDISATIRNVIEEILN